MKSFLLLIALILFPQFSHAYFVAVPGGKTTIDYSKPARILLAGRGTDLSVLPQMSAMGVALLYQRNFPNDQIVLISVFEDQASTKYTEGGTNELSLLKAGWNFVTKNDVYFNTESAMGELVKFQKINSLEFFGHNSAHLGTQTDGLGYRFDFRDSAMELLTPLFQKNAFVIIHGCNSAWMIAQDMAKLWNIPVAGSFTETRFEYLYSDGHFYRNVDGKSPGNKWATHNPDIDGLNCNTGACIRMRTAYSRYIGKWGDFDGPLLPHYKFFCHLEQKECEKAMALSLYGYLAEQSLRPDSNADDFKEVAKQYFCPVYADRVITNDCLQQLELIAQGKGKTKIHYTVNNQQLVCTLTECKAKLTCDDHICAPSERVSKGSTTLHDEFLHYLNGFKYLQDEGM